MPRPLGLLTSAASALVLTGSLLTSGPASAAPEPSVEQRAMASIVIDGGGFGHGKGMSQHGAQGAALKGLSHPEILAFYYPGTTLSSFATKVSVLLTGATGKHLVVKPRRGLRVRDLGRRKTWQLPTARATRWRLVGQAGGRTRIDVRKPGGWKVWRRARGEAQFVAGGKPITLRTPSGWKPYRGTLRSATATAGAKKRDTVNILSLEKYLRGVVPTEMPASWSPAAVRSQAVAARTYAAYELQDAPPSRHYQICDTTACQVYGGLAAEHPGSDAAIKATRKQVLTHGGKPAFTQFSASNGGWSAPGSMPYLVAKKDPYDGWSGNSNHSWSVTVRAAAIESRWPAIGDFTGATVLARDGHGQWGGRATSVRLTGTKRSLELTGDQFRFGLGLRSTYFTLR